MDDDNQSRITKARNEAERAAAAAEAIHVKLAAWLLVSNAAGLLAVFNGLIQGQVCDWHAIRPFIVIFAAGAASALLSAYFVRRTHLATRDFERSTIWMYQEEKVTEATLRRMSRAANTVPKLERAAFRYVVLSAAFLLAAIASGVFCPSLRASLCSTGAVEQTTPEPTPPPEAQAQP